MLLNDIVIYFLYFFIYSFIGWVAECIFNSIQEKKLVNRGFLTGPYCPVYGFGAVAGILFVRPFSYSPVLVFLLGMIIMTIIEFLASYILEKLFHEKWWDYTGFFLNIDGRVCLFFSTMFGVLFLFVIYFVHPPIESLVLPIAPLYRTSLLIICSCVFLTDLFLTVKALLEKNKTFKELEVYLQAMVVKYQQYVTENSLKIQIERLLEKTEVDEQLQLSFVNFKAKIEELDNRNKRIKRRLELAFPNKKSLPNVMEIKQIIDIVKEESKTKS